MINESLMDQCLTIACSLKPSHKMSREMFRVMKNFVDWNVKTERFQNNDKTFDAVIGEFKDKFELLRLIVDNRDEEGASFKLAAFSEKISNGRLKNYVDTLECYDKPLSDNDIEDFFNKTLVPKTEFCDIVGDIPKFKNVLTNIETGEYGDYTKISEEWNELVLKQYKNIVMMKKFNAISESIALDVNEDTFEHVMDRLKSTIDINNIVQSGFSDIDDSLPYCGFEKRRIYIMGGESGVGKSIFLMNVMANDIKKLMRSKISEKEEPTKTDINKEKPKAHLFITAENLIDESLLRFYCCLTGRPLAETIKQVRENKNFSIKDEILTYTKNAGVNVLFYYVPSMVASLLDIESIIDSYVQKYDLRAVFIDYLDLIRSGTRTDVRYLELGEVSTGLKRFATTYDVPVLTVTQLNRSGYGSNSSASLTSISGSMEKVNDADFVAFIQRSDKDEETITDNSGRTCEGSLVKCSILKNRNGEAGHKFNLFLTKKMDGMKVFNYTFMEVPKSQPMHMNTMDDYESEILNGYY